MGELQIRLFEISRINQLPEGFNEYYHTHLLCHQGTISFSFNDKKMNCKGREFVFWFAESRLKDLICSNNFRATVLLVDSNFLNENIPNQSWSIDAILHSRRYPIKRLNDKDDRQRVLSNFRLLYDKFRDKEHRFYEEALKLQTRLFVLEMWHTFANEYERRKRSLQSGTLYERFTQLVHEHCLKKREVQYYANRLNITAKHLCYICKQNSGVTASVWIQRYTRERIILLLENSDLNIAEIADEMEFSSRSFFTRYVKKVLGVAPSEYRNRLR